LKVRWVALTVFLVGLVYTGLVASEMGREFMPELEEGNLFVRGTFPVNVSLGEAAERSRQLRRGLQQVPALAGIMPAPSACADRLLQRRDVHPAPPRFRVADRPVARSAADEGGTDPGHERGAARELPRRGLGHLADHPRQRAGGALGGEGRELDQDIRPRPR